MLLKKADPFQEEGGGGSKKKWPSSSMGGGRDKKRQETAPVLHCTSMLFLYVSVRRLPNLQFTYHLYLPTDLAVIISSTSFLCCQGKSYTVTHTFVQ